MANSWRYERWDSLRLLTPNWQSRLPDAGYEGADPHGYMTAADVVDLITGFAAHVGAPVRTSTNVASVRRTDHRYRVTTTHGEIQARAVLVASGACNRPTVPALAHAVPPGVEQFTPFEYRNPSQLPDGACSSSAPRPRGCSWRPS